MQSRIRFYQLDFIHFVLMTAFVFSIGLEFDEFTTGLIKIKFLFFSSDFGKWFSIIGYF